MGKTLDPNNITITTLTIAVENATPAPTQNRTRPTRITQEDGTMSKIEEIIITIRMEEEVVGMVEDTQANRPNPQTNKLSQITR